MLRKSIVASVLGIMIVLVLPLLITVLNTTNVANAISQTVTFSVSAATSLTMSVASEAAINILPTESGVFSSVNLPVTVRTNNETGYTLSMATTNTSLVRTTALPSGTVPAIATIDNNGGSGYTAAQFESSNNTMNKWGYKVDSGNYLPLTTSNTTIKQCTYEDIYGSNATCTPQSGSGDITTINFASKIDNNTPSGTYSNTLILMTVANIMTSNCPTGYICYDNNGADNALGGGTMSNQAISTSNSSYTGDTLWAANFSYQNYGFAGWNTRSDGKGTTYGPNQTLTSTEITNLVTESSGNGITLYANWIPAERDNNNNYITMQDWAGNNGCSSMSLYDVIALKDARDNNVYAIAKLPMWEYSGASDTVGHIGSGACWMIENMRITNSATISSTNTNNPLSTLTELATSTTSWCVSQNAECYNQSKLNTINITTDSNYAGATGGGNDNNLAVYSYGNYYNWYSVTAGNGTYEFNTSAASTSGDICPLNWYLPKGGSFGAEGGQTINKQNSDFFKLMKAIVPNNTDPNQINQYDQYSYDNTTGATGALRSYPNNFVYSGNWYGSQARNRGTDGRYWSSTAYTAANACRLYFDSSTVLPGTGDNGKYFGFTARCLTGN